jgi:hypothetical protein
MSRSCKLNCTVSAGMFANEFMAKVTAISPDGGTKNVHLFVDRTCLENVHVNNKREGSAQLRAVEVSTTKAGVAVVLPQATFENGPSLLVPREAVVK